MRFLMLSFAVAACTSTPEGPAAPTTVRAQLAQPTRLLVPATPAAGTITARRYTHDGWQTGTIDVAIANGELVASADATGQLALATFSVNAEPIDVPADVFGTPAQLRDVRLVLTAKPAAATTWTDDDNATATAMLALDLTWTLAVNGHATPLGAQLLPPIPVDVALTGTGGRVDATVDLHGAGELWSWAGLLELTDLQLALTATSSY